MHHSLSHSTRTLVCGGLLAVLAGCSRAPEIPTSTTLPEPAPVAAVPAPEPVAAPAPVAKTAPVAPTPAAPRPRKPAPAPVVAAAPPVVATSAAVPVALPPPVCSNCGTITDIKTVKVAGKSTGLGAVAGGLAGLIIGNQIGDGSGKTVAKVAGAAGGAYAGHRIEQNARADTHYDVTVRLDSGNTTVVSQATEPTLSVGTAVRIVDGMVVAM